MPGIAVAITFVAPKLGIVVPLAVLCIAIVVAIPVVARTGKLTIPAAGLIAVGGIIVGLLVGYLSGTSRIRGTPVGVGLAIVFYLLVAAVLGCVLGIFFYREPKRGA